MQRDYELVGNVEEGEPIEEFDPNFDMVLKYFKKKAVFQSKS
jgi:thiol:disulfide interchange protein DsbD